MKRFSMPALLLAVALVLSGCGSQAAPPPTVSPLEIQNTMVAAAFTMVAETQSAVPTVTPLPPTATVTNTPFTTDTPLPLPFSDLTLTPAPSTSAGGGDPCINKTLPPTLKGKPVKIRVNNSTKGTVQLSVYLNQTTGQDVCGYRTYSIEPQQSIVLNNLIEGCYSLWAWNPDPEAYFMVTNGTSCLDSADTWVFDITTGSLRLKT